jgi:flagellar hook-associated protein 1 FlgK
VSQIGNKTRELEVTTSAADKLLTEARTALENESGVNLDEEAANLLRYQQAYQAAAKIMQIAKEMFDMLLTIGR